MRIDIRADSGSIVLAGMPEPGLETGDAVEVESKMPGVGSVVNDLRFAMPARCKMDG